MKWFRKAAEQGQKDAMYGLGEMYEQGRGVRRNTAEAKKWFSEAEKKGVTHAHMLESYRKSAAEGKASEQYWLGVLLAEGRGVPRDSAEAKKWLEMAAQQGYPAAKGALKKLGKVK